MPKYRNDAQDYNGRSKRRKMQSERLDDSDSDTDTYFFRNLRMYILPSNIGNSRRKVLQNLIEKHGGTVVYSVTESTTHVLVDETISSASVCRALGWATYPPHVNVVMVGWLSSSIRANCCIDITDFEIPCTHKPTFVNNYVNTAQPGASASEPPENVQENGRNVAADVRRPVDDRGVSNDDLMEEEGSTFDDFMYDGETTCDDEWLYKVYPEPTLFGLFNAIANRDGNPDVELSVPGPSNIQNLGAGPSKCNLANAPQSSLCEASSSNSDMYETKSPENSSSRIDSAMPKNSKSGKFLEISSLEPKSGPVNSEQNFPKSSKLHYIRKSSFSSSNLKRCSSDVLKIQPNSNGEQKTYLESGASKVSAEVISSFVGDKNSTIVTEVLNINNLDPEAQENYKIVNESVNCESSAFKLSDSEELVNESRELESLGSKESDINMVEPETKIPAHTTFEASNCVESSENKSTSKISNFDLSVDVSKDSSETITSDQVVSNSKDSDALAVKYVECRVIHKNIIDSKAVKAILDSKPVKDILDSNSVKNLNDLNPVSNIPGPDSLQLDNEALVKQVLPVNYVSSESVTSKLSDSETPNKPPNKLLKLSDSCKDSPIPERLISCVSEICEHARHVLSAASSMEKSISSRIISPSVPEVDRSELSESADMLVPEYSKSPDKVCNSDIPLNLEFSNSSILPTSVRSDADVENSDVSLKCVITSSESGSSSSLPVVVVSESLQVCSTVLNTDLAKSSAVVTSDLLCDPKLSGSFFHVEKRKSSKLKPSGSKHEIPRSPEHYMDQPGCSGSHLNTERLDSSKKLSGESSTSRPPLPCVPKRKSLIKAEARYKSSYSSYIYPNCLIISKLQVLYETFKRAGQKWRVYVYEKAIIAVRSQKKPIKTIEDVKALTGVGKKMIDKIWEIMQTGHLKEIDEICSWQRASTIKLFTRVWGIGPRTAVSLYNLGFRTLHDLRTKSNVSRAVQVGLRYFHDLRTKMPRKEAEKILSTVLSRIFEMYPSVQCDACSSLRRNKRFCGHVDILVSLPEGQSNNHRILPEVVARLHQEGFLIDDLIRHEENGAQTKYVGIFKLKLDRAKHRRLDITVCTADEYACALMHLTGPADFNRAIRQVATKKSMILDGHSLRIKRTVSSPEKIMETPTEAAIFRHLNLPYRIPEQREYCGFR